MERCPRCDSNGTLQTTPSGVPACPRCGWTLDGSPAPPRPFIPSWKLLLPLVVPMGVLWGAAWTHNVRVHTPGQKLAVGITFLILGVWSAVCAYLWKRLTPRFRKYWYPPNFLAPLWLAVAFSMMGGNQLADAMRALLK